MGQTIRYCPFDSYYRNNLIHNTNGVKNIWPVGCLSQFCNNFMPMSYRPLPARQPNIKIRLKNPQISLFCTFSENQIAPCKSNAKEVNSFEWSHPIGSRQQAETLGSI